MISRGGMHADNGFCASAQRACTRRRLDGYQFCWRHILEDRSSPYRQCGRISAPTGRRCTNAAPKSDRKEGLCVDHQAQAAQACQRDAARRRCLTAASLLEQLEHYRPATSRSGFGGSGGGGDAATSGAIVAAKLHPKHGGNVGVQLARAVAAQPVGADAATAAAGWTSSDDSCAEELPRELTWRGEPNSDDDSIDSEGDDPFKYTDVFTEEEAVRITREKMIRLQSLYVEQFKHLKQELIDSRRQYLAAAAKADSSSQGLSASPSYLPPKMDATSGAASAAITASSILARERNRAALRYRKKIGIEALMHQRSKDRLAAAAGSSSGGAPQEPSLPPAMQRCIAGSGRAGRCNSQVVPLSKYCLRHISSDPHQVLFKRCSFLVGRCERLVPAIFSSAPRCDLHEGFSSGRAAAIIQRAQRLALPSPQPPPTPRQQQRQLQQQQQHRQLLTLASTNAENGSVGGTVAVLDTGAAVVPMSADLPAQTVGGSCEEQNSNVSETCMAEGDQTSVTACSQHLPDMTATDDMDVPTSPPRDNEN